MLALKGVIGGTMVIAFALVGEVVRPRELAGVTSAAPSVALAGLAVTVATTGTVAAFNVALGMVAGAVALLLWCLVGTEAVKRLGAMRGSLATTVVWFVAALTIWAVVLR